MTPLRWPPDPAAKPRSAAAWRAAADLLSDGPCPWPAVVAHAAAAAGIGEDFATTVILRACKAGAASWTGAAEHAGRLLHLGRVAGSGVARCTATPRPLPPLPRPDVEALLRTPEASEVLAAALAALDRDGDTSEPRAGAS